MTDVSVPGKPPFPMPQRERPLDGVWVEHHPGTTKVMVEGRFENGLRHGSWKRYHANGQLAEDYGWERGVKHGPELDWTESGTKICDGTNVRGKRSGTWTWWNADGSLRDTLVYDDAQRRQGPYVWNDEGDAPRARGTWLDDQFHGAWTWWNEGAWEKLERAFDRGTQHGKELAWSPGGKLAVKRSFVRGKKHGEEETFDAEGRPTFKGEWQYGHAIGEHVTWDAERKETRVAFSAGIPTSVANDKKLATKIVKKLKKAKDRYKKVDAIGDSVEYGQRAPYLVHLWRSGAVDVAADHELWELFAEASGLLDGKDVIAFLAKAKTKNAYSNVLPSWPRDLDTIVMNVYARDPAPIDAAWESLPRPIRNGVAFVRARFGHDIGDDLHEDLPLLVKQHVENFGLGELLWPDESGVLRMEKLFSDFSGTKTAFFDRLIAFFGGTERWVAALRGPAFGEAGETVARVSFRTFRDVIERATPDEMKKLLAGIALDSDTQDLAYAALASWRKDDPETTAEIAIGITDDGLRKWPAVATAILRLAEAKKPIPEKLVEAIELDQESPTYTSSWYTEPLRVLAGLEDHERSTLPYRRAYIDASPGGAVPRLKILRDALRVLEPARRKSVFERVLASEYKKLDVAQYLHLVDDRALVERFLDLMEESSYGHQEAVVYGIGEIGVDIVPLITPRLEKAKTKEWKEGWHKAILVALARTAVDRGEVAEEHDAFVRFDVIKDDSTWRAYAPFVERILYALPPARAEKILLAGLASSTFSRAFSMIGCQPTAAVLERAFTELLAREKELRYEQQRDVTTGIASLPDARAWVEWVRRSGSGGGIVDALRNAIGGQAYDEVEEALSSAGAPAIEEIDPIEKVRLRAIEASGDERIYLLRPKNARDEKTLNVIGGAPPGVDAKRWPTFDDEPMTHLFTLDVRTMPELAKRVGKDVRAISVFCWNPDLNEAYVRDTKQTAVVLTRAAQLAKPASVPEELELREESGFEIVAVDVDASVWFDKSELATEIYRLPARVLGNPIWLQGDEDEDDGGGGDGFLMQFDESFCSVNLGDCGVMYVFEDSAFWQCH